MKPDIAIVIDKLPESLNVLRNLHWTKLRVYHKMWETLIWAEVYQKKILPASGRVRAKITFVFDNNHPHDWDNYIGGCVGIFNGLKKTILIDDCMSIISIIEFDYRIEDKTKTIIEIWRLENEPDQDNKMPPLQKA